MTLRTRAVLILALTLFALPIGHDEVDGPAAWFAETMARTADVADRLREAANYEQLTESEWLLYRNYRNYREDDVCRD